MCQAPTKFDYNYASPIVPYYTVLLEQRDGRSHLYSGSNVNLHANESNHYSEGRTFPLSTSKLRASISSLVALPSQ
jgi:hypothetical protein